MLQSIREHSQGWLAWLIVGLISIPFALWGINSYLNGASKVSVASVNGTEISLTQYQNALQNYRDRLQAMFGNSFDIDSMDQNALKQDVINGLIEQQVLKQLGHDVGMRISDDQVSSRIQSMDPFKDETGQFSNAVYERRLLQSNASPAVFEQQLRSDMIQEQLRRAISDSAFVTEREKNRIARLEAQKRSIFYTILPAQKFKKSLDISDQEITEYYEKNKEKYKTEESVRIKYIDLSVDGLAKHIEVDEATLKDYYKSNLATYTIGERRIAQHILVALKPDANAEEVKKARESAGKLLALVKSGVDFDEIPQKHENLLSGEDEVGTTGAISKGVMPPEFDDALFSLKVGDISEPVRSKRGFHIIKLVEIKPEKTSTYDEVKDNVEMEYRKEKAESKYYEVADELQNLVFENPDSLDVAAETLRLEIKTSEPFTRTHGDKLTSRPEVIKAAFSQEVLEGANSEPLELSETRLIVLRTFDHKPATIKKLSSVKEEIKTVLLNNKAKEKAKEQGQKILAKLKEGADPEQVARDESIEWKKNDSVSRDDPDVKRSVLRTAFKLGRPVENKPVYEGFSDGLYDYAVLGVTAVKDADIEWSGTDESAKKMIEQLQQARSIEEWQDFISTIKQHADIEIYPEAL